VLNFGFQISTKKSMEVQPKYKKKVEVICPNSSPEARAARCKRLRNLANLSRKEMCIDGVLNINTLKGWELGRYGGLPRDGAQRVIKRVARAGVVCSLEWLLHGKGMEPQLGLNTEVGHNIKGSDGSEENGLIESDIVARELSFFKQQLPKAVWMKVDDDGMLPVYAIDDFVAGEKYFGKELDQLVKKDCIVQLVTGELVFRNLQFGSEDMKYNLVCLNPHSSVKHPVLYNQEIIFAAAVVWHRKTNYLLK